MTMNRRDKMLLLVLPALLLFIGYTTYGLSHWRTQLATAEKGITSTRERMPNPAEERSRRDKLAAAGREARGETEAIDKLKLQIATSTKSLEREKSELAAAKNSLSSGEHRDEMTKIESAHRIALQKLEASHLSALAGLETQSAAALARLWQSSKGPKTDRTQRIELLNKVLARYDLTILDATDDANGAASPPRLQAVMKAAAETNGLAPPKPRQLKLRGKYSEIAGALDSLARGDAWAIPLGLTMKPAADGLFEWTLTVWV